MYLYQIPSTFTGIRPTTPAGLKAYFSVHLTRSCKRAREPDNSNAAPVAIRAVASNCQEFQFAAIRRSFIDNPGTDAEWIKIFVWIDSNNFVKLRCKPFSEVEFNLLDPCADLFLGYDILRKYPIVISVIPASVDFYHFSQQCRMPVRLVLPANFPSPTEIHDVLSLSDHDSFANVSFWKTHAHVLQLDLDALRRTTELEKSTLLAEKALVHSALGVATQTIQELQEKHRRDRQSMAMLTLEIDQLKARASTCLLQQHLVCLHISVSYTFICFCLSCSVLS